MVYYVYTPQIASKKLEFVINILIYILVLYTYVLRVV